MSGPEPAVRGTTVIAAVAVGAILVLGLVGAIAGLVTPPEPPRDPGPVPTYAGARPGDLAGHPGTTLRAGGLDVSAEPLVDTGDQRCTTVTLTNSGATTLAHDPADWHLDDDAGPHTAVAPDDGSALLGAGTLTAGSTTSGRICFTAGRGPTTLVREPSSGDRLVWVSG